MNLSTFNETLLDQTDIERAISRISMGIAGRYNSAPLAIVGLLSQGDIIAKRIAECLKELGAEAQCGSIDISLYRDDLGKGDAKPSLRSSDIPFSTDEMRVVLVDDVLHTGRTIRAALNALFDYGRPAVVELACLIDRGGREVPIQPDYVGHIMHDINAKVIVSLPDENGVDSVKLIHPNT